ncbi:MAG: peptidoglycan-binding protein [Clostridia bacterium]|nr:peptidoglycan-binding protein [Clostridia bacterium]
MAQIPVIPERVRVKLGAADSGAAVVTVPFPEYIKNVASSEIYPTWPEEAIRANVLAEISFALNRIYTEYYPSMGYDFDITNNTASDQAFIYGRDVYENISLVVDEIFNSYIVRRGNVEPLFALYCDGIRSTCDGLSQWGSVELANKGLDALEILKNYFGENIEIVTNAPITDVRPSIPGRPLGLGTYGNDVAFIQLRLNRISTNYPAIPKIPIVDGAFGVETENAVRQFQQVFGLTVDGVVGKATWYKIQLVFNAVKRLSELSSEGLTFDDVTTPFPDTLSIGDEGFFVYGLQYYLRWISLSNPAVPNVEFDGIFGPETENAVKTFQRFYGFEPTGVVDDDLFETIFDVYRGVIETTREELVGEGAPPFPGEVLKLGSEGDDVRVLQEFINATSSVYPQVPSVDVTGVFDENTRDAVYAAQALFDYPINGVVGPVLWDTFGIIYSAVIGGENLAEGQFSGADMSLEE